MILSRSKTVLVHRALADFTVLFINMYYLTKYSFIEALSISDKISFVKADYGVCPGEGACALFPRFS